MPQKKWSPVSIHGLIILGLVLIFMGCFKKPVETISVDKAQATEKEMAAQKQSAAGTAGEQTAAEQSAVDKKAKSARYAAQKRVLKTIYVVKKGDSLWWIAKYKDIYNDPYLWPILFDANNKVIKDPNKIYPGMKLQIPRAGYKPADIRNARNKAGARKPYNPPARAVPPVD
jgi:LysM repeat protein